MPSFSSSCFCRSPASSHAGDAPSRAGGIRLWSPVLRAAAKGGRGFNKARLKVGDLLLLCCLTAISLPLDGRGGEGKGWGIAVGNGSGGSCGGRAESGRFFSSPSSSRRAAFLELIIVGLGCKLLWLCRAGDSSDRRAVSRGQDCCWPQSSTSWPGAVLEALLLGSRGREQWRPHRPKWFVPGIGEVDFELPEGLDCVPKSVVEILFVIVQGPGCIFFSCVGPDVSRVVSLAKF